MKLTVESIINSLGGFDIITSVGERSNNKYLIYPINTIEEQLKNAHELNLQDSNPLDILDIGTGAGFFPFICKLYGHKAESCDDALPGSIYLEGYNLLNLEPITCIVEKNTSIGGVFKNKFDIITSFRSQLGTTIVVEGGDSEYVWSTEDWKFFFKDCSKHLLKSNDSFIDFQCNDIIHKEFFAPYQTIETYLRRNKFRITKEQIDQDLT